MLCKTHDYLTLGVGEATFHCSYQYTKADDIYSTVQPMQPPLINFWCVLVTLKIPLSDTMRVTGEYVGHVMTVIQMLSITVMETQHRGKCFRVRYNQFRVRLDNNIKSIYPPPFRDVFAIVVYHHPPAFGNIAQRYL